MENHAEIKKIFNISAYSGAKIIKINYALFCLSFCLSLNLKPVNYFTTKRSSMAKRESGSIRPGSVRPDNYNCVGNHCLQRVLFEVDFLNNKRSLSDAHFKSFSFASVATATQIILATLPTLSTG
jgi:hypothetical protein